MTKTLVTFTLAGAVVLVLGACGVDVHTDADGSKTVNVASPFGSVNINTDVNPSKTGLPVYPGARLKQDGGDANSADVNVSGGGALGVKIVAAEMESQDAPQPIVDFYKREMQKYGSVTECRGEIDFDGRNADHPVCKQDSRKREQQLVVGTSGEHRLVSVKPRGAGSEFAMVYIRTSN